MRALRALGMDGAVTYTFLARLTSIVASTGTVLLIIRFLTPAEQGYYYTLLSLVALQMVFELGFSFVILQLAAHETARLTLFPDGHIEGDSAAHTRLASVFQLTVKWYLWAAIALALLLLPLGIAFFSRKGGAASHVAWFGPWVAAVIVVSLSFLLTPLFSFLEGCNQVREIAQLRMVQSLISLVLAWTAIASGHGLYASALVNSGSVAIGGGLLYSRRRLLVNLLRHPGAAGAVSWREEVWPFQWKIAIAWLSSYFTFQVFTPILFAFRGPQEAGRMGLSLSIVAYIPFVALCWITPKAAPFGRLVNLGRLQELDRMFFRALRQSLALVVAIAAACEICVIAVKSALPGIAARMESPRIFVLLLATAIGSFLVQGLAVYLRSFKREPYLVQSVVVAALTTAVALLTAAHWGSAAIALDYFAVSGVLGLAWALLIFRSFRDQNFGAVLLRDAQQAG
ncbi:MAG: hypothetical protein ABSF23_03185 [Terracidiphilus sp.]|jgi:hypothetical protein